jgi:hypothetical protein
MEQVVNEPEEEDGPDWCHWQPIPWRRQPACCNRGEAVDESSEEEEEATGMLEDGLGLDEDLERFLLVSLNLAAWLATSLFWLTCHYPNPVVEWPWLDTVLFVQWSLLFARDPVVEPLRALLFAAGPICWTYLHRAFLEPYVAAHRAALVTDLCKPQGVYMFWCFYIWSFALTAGVAMRRWQGGS